MAMDNQFIKKLDLLLEQLSKTRSVKKMNKILYQCKDMVMDIKFNENDVHHQFMKDQLFKFGIAINQFDQAWSSIKKVWASKFNERAFLATKKLGISLK